MEKLFCMQVQIHIILKHIKRSKQQVQFFKFNSFFLFRLLNYLDTLLNYLDTLLKKIQIK